MLLRNIETGKVQDLPEHFLELFDSFEPADCLNDCDDCKVEEAESDIIEDDDLEGFVDYDE